MSHVAGDCNARVDALMNALDIIEAVAERTGKDEERRHVRQLKKDLHSVAKNGNSLLTRHAEATAELARIVMPKPRFIVDGCHAGILFGDVGYEELDDPRMAMEKLFALLDLALSHDAGFSLDWGMSTLEEVSKLLPDDIERLRAVIESTDRIEIVNGSYSQPFPMTIGWESNIRQFEEGLRCADAILGVRPRTYVAQEFGHHPQMPQILKGYGFDGCALRVRLNGEVPSCEDPIVWWEGDDGTAILCLTTLESVPTCDECAGLFYRSLAPGFASLEMSDADFGAFNNLEDVVYPVLDRTEAIICPNRDDILGKFSTYSEVIDAVRDMPIRRAGFASASFRPSVCQNAQLFGAIRAAEAILIVTEILDVYAHILGIELELDQIISDSWRMLLAAENHDSFVVPDHIPGTYTVERSAIFGSYHGLRSNKTVGEKGLELAKDATHACTVAVDRLKVAVGAEINRGIGGSIDAFDLSEQMWHSLALLDVSGVKGKKSTIGRLDFPLGEMTNFRIEFPGTEAEWQVVDEDRWDDGSLRSADVAVQADIPALGWLVARVSPEDEASEAAQNDAIASITDGAAVIDTGLIGAKVTLDPILRVDLQDGSSGEGLACIDITRPGSGGDCKVVATGPVMGEIRVDGGENNEFGTVSCSAWKNEPSVRVECTQAAQHEYVIRPNHRINRVLADYPFGIGEVTPGVFHALNVVVIETEETNLCIVHAGDPYFEYELEENLVRYAPRCGPSSIRVFVLHDCDDPLEISRSCMLKPLMVQPPHISSSSDRATKTRGEGDGKAFAGRLIDIRGDVIITSLRRTQIDEVEIRLFNSGREDRQFGFGRLPGYGAWQETRLDGMAVKSGCRPCLCGSDGWVLPPGRIATFRCRRRSSSPDVAKQM